MGWHLVVCFGSRVYIIICRFPGSKDFFLAQRELRTENYIFDIIHSHFRPLSWEPPFMGIENNKK